MVSHVTALMGNRHLDSPPTTCLNTLCLPKGLWQASGPPLHSTCMQCMCVQEGSLSAKEALGAVEKSRVPDIACRPA